MGREDDKKSDEILADEVIDRLYEVAVDPTRYEALLDHWEAMIRPQRTAANLENNPPANPTLGLKKFEGHFHRADQVLDRLNQDRDLSDPVTLVAQVPHAAAFAVDRSLTITAVNAAATSVLGVTRGARLSDLALEAGESDQLGNKIARLLQGNNADPVVIRTRSARYITDPRSDR